MSETDSSTYDVFVSAKSEDYPHATIAAKYLRDSGLRVFFSQQELQEMGNSDYYSAIDDALEFSRHMLVVTSSRANVTSSWVKKEWQTFLNEKLSGRKTGNVVTLLCDGMTIGDLPLSLRQHEARSNQDLASLLNYFKSPSRPKTVAPEPLHARAPELEAASHAKPAGSHDVYISYSSKDKSAADATLAYLEDHGINCWIAPRDVQVGATWSASITKAIRSARVMVLIFSRQSNSSQQAVREVEFAANNGAAIITLRIEDVAPMAPLSRFLGSFQWLDAFSQPLEPRLAQLARAIRAVLARPNR